MNCYASESHYLSHVAPIAQQSFPLFIPHTLTSYADALGLTYSVGKPKGGPTLVASYKDYRAIPGPIVYLEHGAGQTYVDAPDNPCYSGGAGLERVILFLCPSRTVADRWKRYPVPAEVVGVPKLDALRGVPLGDEVAISFHSNLAVCPETRSAFRHYTSALTALREEFSLLGHAHPRVMRKLRPIYERHGIEVVEDFSVIVARAHTYLVDNSSTGFEMAELGRRVVWLNDPRYRRHVSHGLRFWEVSPTVDRPEELPDAIRAKRLPEGPSVYDYHDTHATQRAVEAIMAHVPQ